MKAGMKMVKMKEFTFVYFIGSIGYRFIEILWRGRTHWSMGIVGGVCFICMYTFECFMKKMKLPMKALLSTCCVTCVEFLSGLILNKGLGLAVWDYSNLRFNLFGQISLIYSVLWYFLCIPAHLLCKLIKQRIFNVLTEPKRHLTKIFERQPNIR